MQAAPQDFDSLVLPGAVLVEEMPTEVLSRNIYVDALHKVLLNGAPMLLHLEFQTKGDREMAQRLLEYNVLATCKYKLPVCSCVLYI